MKNAKGLFSLLFLASAAYAQAPAPLAFEVATIKPSAPLEPAALESGRAHVGTKIDAARVDIGSASLFRLICGAYGLKPYQVSGPDWLKTTMYDIQAKIPDGVTSDKVPEMLQTLLIERFGLKVRHESKEQPVYALVVAKGGPKLKESAPEPAPAADTPDPRKKAVANSMAVPSVQGDLKVTHTADGIAIEMPGGEIIGKLRASVKGGGGAPPIFHVESSGATMKTFAEMLSVGVIDRPVVDMTGLTRNYDVALDLSAEDAINVARASITFLPARGGGDARTPAGGGGDRGGAASDPAGASVFASIQNLGLKLEPRKLPLDTLIVDHIEKLPTAN